VFEPVGNEGTHFIYIIMLKPIPNFPDYFLDRLGNVYSSKKTSKPKKISPSIHPTGHKYVDLYRDGISSTLGVAPLMLETFVSKRPPGKIACHGAKGSSINTLDNIYWGTWAQNNGSDKMRDGTHYCGIKHFKAILNELQVRIIKRAFSRYGCGFGLSGRELAKIFNVCPSTICAIIKHVNWKHLR
jgi:hypothetical protein